MIKKLKFSVAISVYKNDVPQYFDRALESITSSQSILPDEIVVVVDGPVSNDIQSVIDKYVRLYKEMVKVVYLPNNGGLGNALKIAIDKCRCELIARMDSDDVALPTRFEQQLSYFEKDPTVDIVGGDITEFIGEETNVVGKRCVPLVHCDITDYMKRRCAFNHVSVMYKKTAVLHAGGYLDLFWNEDYYLWIRMQIDGAKFANTGTVLVNVRTGKDMYARRGGKKYFRSEKFLQKYMLEHKMISFPTYTFNVIKRWIVQCLLPNSVRGWIFRNFARTHIVEK